MLVIARRSFRHRRRPYHRGDLLDVSPTSARMLLNAQMVRFPTADDVGLREPETGRYLRRDLRATE